MAEQNNQSPREEQDKKELALQIEGKVNREGTLPATVGHSEEDKEALLETVAFAKPKKKRNVKKIVFAVIGGALALLIAVNIISGLLRGPDPIYVTTSAVETGVVQQTLSTSGVLSTGESRTVYSPVSAPVDSLNLETGTYVQAGEQIVTFDTTDLERSYRTASASAGLASSQRRQAEANSAESQQSANEYQASIDLSKTQLAETQGYIASLNAKKAELEAAGATAEDLAAVMEEIAVQEAEAARLTQLIAQMEASRDAANKGVLDEEGQRQQQLSGVASQVSFESAKEALEAGEAGVTAPISGIVTAVAASEGTLASQYGALCTIQSLEKVNVVVALSRYDLERVREGQKGTVTTLGREYAATITKIDRMATTATTTSGTSSYVNCTVSLDAPDSEIILGLDANVEIATGQADDVIAVPISAVNTDVSGTYCYVVEEGVARRVDITLGLSGDTVVEITSGLSVGQELILSSSSVYEGAAVTTDPAYAPTQGIVQVAVG